MKRKIALAMAAVMAFGSVLTMPFTAQAASVTRVIDRIITGGLNAGDGTMLSGNRLVHGFWSTNSEHGMEFSIGGTRQLRNRQGQQSNQPGNATRVGAAEIEIELTNDVAWESLADEGQRNIRRFNIDLSGANWAILRDSFTDAYFPAGGVPFNNLLADNNWANHQRNLLNINRTGDAGTTNIHGINGLYGGIFFQGGLELPPTPTPYATPTPTPTPEPTPTPTPWLGRFEFGTDAWDWPGSGIEAGIMAAPDVFNSVLPVGVTVAGGNFRRGGGGGPGMDSNGGGRTITFSADVVAANDFINLHVGAVHFLNNGGTNEVLNVLWDVPVTGQITGGSSATSGGTLSLDVAGRTEALTLQWPWSGNNGEEAPGRMNLWSISVVPAGRSLDTELGAVEAAAVLNATPAPGMSVAPPHSHDVGIDAMVEWAARAQAAGYGYPLSAQGDELAFAIEVGYHNPTTATITVFLPEDGIVAGSTLRIPIIGYATGSGPITATVRGGAGFVTAAGPLTLTFERTEGVTNAITIGGPVTPSAGNLVIQNNTIVIEESAPGVLGSQAAFILEAPEGFEFAQTALHAQWTHDQTNVAPWNLHRFGATTANDRWWFDSRANGRFQGTTGTDSASITNQRNAQGVPAWFTPVGNFVVMGGGVGGGIHGISYASHGVSNGDMLNRVGWDRLPQANSIATGAPGDRIVDRTRLLVTLAGLDPMRTSRVEVVIAGLTFIPSVETLNNLEILDAIDEFTLNLVGSAHHVAGVDRRGFTDATDIAGFLSPGSGAAVANSMRISRIGDDTPTMSVGRRQPFAGTLGQTGVATGTGNLAGNNHIGENNLAGRDNGRIIVEELVLDAWCLIRPITFTLTDGSGQPIVDDMGRPQALLSRVQAWNDDNPAMNTTITGGISNAATDGGRRQWTWYGNTRHNRDVIGTSRDFAFSPDGTGITFWRNFRTAGGEDLEQLLRQVFRFDISAPPEFSGPVYVQVSGAGVDGRVAGVNRARVHYFQPRIDVSATSTVIGIGHQSVAVSDITVTELHNNGLGLVNDVFTFSFTEFGLPAVGSGLTFTPVSVANNVHAPQLGLSVVRGQGEAISFRIDRRDTAQVTFELRNVTVRIDRNIPDGVYGIAVTNSNLNMTGAARQSLQNNFDGYSVSDDIWQRAWVRAAGNRSIGTFGDGTNGWFAMDLFPSFGYRVDNFIIVTAGTRLTVERVEEIFENSDLFVLGQQFLNVDTGDDVPVAVDVAVFVENILNALEDDEALDITIVNAQGVNVTYDVRDGVNVPLGTGVTITIGLVEGATMQMTVVVKNDLNGDGELCHEDLMAMAGHIVHNDFSDAQMQAADINADTSVPSLLNTLVRLAQLNIQNVS